jgi:hypothetical protein
MCAQQSVVESSATAFAALADLLSKLKGIYKMLGAANCGILVPGDLGTFCLGPSVILEEPLIA